MKKFMKRAICVAASMSLMLSALTGCGGKGSSAAKTSSPHGGPYEEALIVDVFDSQANFQGMQSGWFAKIVKDKFNMELNLISPNVAGGGDTLYQTRSANGNLGDLIITNLDKSRLKDMVAADLVLDMSDYIKDCSNLQSRMQAIQEASKLAEKDGLWAVPSEISNLSATDSCEAQEPTCAPSLRWDLYGQIGYPKMNNLDDLLKVLKQMQDVAGTSKSGKKAYAISLFKDWDGDTMQNLDGIMGLYGYKSIGFCLGKVDGSEKQSILDDNGMYVRSLKFLFDANQQGLVDPESTTQNFDNIKAKYKDGAILYSLWPWLGAGDYNQTENIEQGKGFATATIADMKCLSYGSMPLGKMEAGIMIGSKAKDPQRLADFIDWLYSPEGIEAANMIPSTTAGPKGLTWDIKDGKPVLTDFGVEAIVNQTKDLKVPDEWGSGTFEDGKCFLNFKSVGLVDTDPETGICYNYQKWEDYQNRMSTKLTEDWKAHNDNAGTGIERLQQTNNLMIIPGTNYAMPEYDTDILTIKEQCKQSIIEYSWKMIFAKNEAEFNSLFQEMKDTVNGLGFEQVYEVDAKNCDDQFAAYEAAKAAK